MVSLAALIVWKRSPYLVFFPWLIIACMDGLYLSSSLEKVPDGAWFTLVLSAVLTSILILWRFGKEQQWQAEADDRFPTSHLVQKDWEFSSTKLAKRHQRCLPNSWQNL
jgi:KUP system potassium uptake protein